MAKKHNPKDTLIKEEKKEFEEEVLQIDRVTRVVKGGRRLRFRATVVIGNRKGKVAIGIGKAAEVAAAIQKGISQAKKNIIEIPIVEGDTIPHEIKLKYKSVLILIMPACQGTGIVAGGATRKIFELGGVKNILAKSFRSNNRVVNAQAVIKAIMKLDQKALKQVKLSKKGTEPAQMEIKKNPDNNLESSNQ